MAHEKIELDEISQCFVEETTEMLSDADNLLLRLEEIPLDSTVIDSIFRKIHSIKGGAGAISNATLLRSLAHIFESCLSKVKSNQLKPNPSCINIFLAATDHCRELISVIKDGVSPSEEQSNRVNGVIGQLNELNNGTTSENPAGPAFETKTNNSKVGGGEDHSKNEDGVFVPNNELDLFMRLSGEQVVLRNSFDALLRQRDLHLDREKLERKLREVYFSLNKLTDQLQDQIMAVRKVKLERTFSKIPRIVRQTSQDLGKKVALNVVGAELAVDKNIANALSAAMTHMVRNSVDHGIESPEKRTAAGKSAEGTLTVTAAESKGTIFITIEDDGAGIDQKRVLEKAVESGLIDISKQESMTDSEIFELIFLPGFSTAAAVTDVSGRGVGMDVVKSAILGLNGKIQIQSKLGKGTSFSIEIPAPKTVMVERTVLADSGGVDVAIPQSAIAKIARIDSLPQTKINHYPTCQFSNQTIRVGTYMNLVSRVPVADASENKYIIIVQFKGVMAGVLVKNIYGQLDAVIKPFDDAMKTTEGFRGTTLLGDDKIAYVISEEQLLTKLATHNESNGADKSEANAA